METKYGIVAYTLGGPKENSEIKLMHLCCYENPLTQDDYKGLEHTFNTDPEFGLVGKMGGSVFLTEATPEMIKMIEDLPLV